MDVQGFKDTIDWYNANAEQYAASSPAYVVIQEINDFIAMLPEKPSVLDAGCGSGRDARLLADRGASVIGVDISEGLLRVARRDNPDIDFVDGDLRQLPFDDAMFDGVYARTSLLHLETVDDMQQALRELARVLRPNGALFVLVKAQTTKHKTAVVSDKLSGHNRFFQYFTLPELKNLLEGANFIIAKIEQYQETKKVPTGRPEVELIEAYARKA